MLCLSSSCPAKAEAAPHGEISHPLPTPVPPTQLGRGITPCQKSDKKGKEQNINLELLQAGCGSCSGLVVNHSVELRMLQIPLPRGTRSGASDPFSIPAALPEPRPLSPPSRARRCFYFNLSINLIVFIGSLIIPFMGEIPDRAFNSGKWILLAVAAIAGAI